jgi:hypothetical protein
MRLLFGAIILFGNVFLTNYLASLGDTFHVGKDNGLEFKIFSLCVCASLYFYILSKELRFLLAGFFVGLGIYILLFIFYMVTDNIGWNFHFIGNHLIVAGLVFIFGILFFLKTRSKQ